MRQAEPFIGSNHRWAIFFASVIAFAGSSLGFHRQVAAQSPLDRPAASHAIELLVKMQSDRFSERQRAMFKILESPETTLSLLEKRIESGDGDFRLRALNILQRVAMGSDTQSEQAFDALRNISLSSDVVLSRKAQLTSYEVLLYRQHVAAKKLERLNAHIVYSQILDDQTYPLADRLTIDQDWRGNRDDLEQISQLFGLSFLELDHHQVDDQLFLNVDSIYALSHVKLKRCSITDKTIEYLSRLNSLGELEILYCPIGTGCFESLEKFQRMSSIRLIGTNIEPACAELLEQKLNVATDIRRGAFLGIRYSPAESVCRLTSIVPGSGAEKAGFRIGDEIVKFNEHPIKEHRQLTRYLREQMPGVEATVRIKRDGSEIELAVVMGEWD